MNSVPWSRGDPKKKIHVSSHRPPLSEGLVLLHLTVVQSCSDSAQEDWIDLLEISSLTNRFPLGIQNGNGTKFPPCADLTEGSTSQPACWIEIGSVCPSTVAWLWPTTGDGKKSTAADHGMTRCRRNFIIGMLRCSDIRQQPQQTSL